VAVLTTTFIVLSHAASLAFAVYTAQRGGVGAQVLLYAFIIDYILRLASIRPLYFGSRSNRPWVRAMASALSRRPSSGQAPEPLVEQHSGRQLGLWGHLGLMALLSYFAFVLANVDADRQLSADLATVLDDLDWAIVLAATYWVNALVTRTIVVDPGRPPTKSFGYNTRELGMLAVAVLIGGAVVAVRQMNGYQASAWSVMGPLLAIRTLGDLLARLKGVGQRPLRYSS
jgi:hypothetical protein